LLGLNKSIQQDPQEFHKLFLSKIESANLLVRQPASQIPSLHQVLSGRVRYQTRCLTCNAARGQEHDFHELDLSIEGCRSVEEAIRGYTASEMLDGENKYDCGSCRGRQVAERSTEIVRTPRVLCLHLLRYGYDRKTFERKKLKSEVALSDEMEVGGTRYKLVSALYHKGRSAYGGHYVCDVLAWETGQWWHCDDESVVRTTNPASRGGGGGGGKSEVVDCTGDEVKKGGGKGSSADELDDTGDSDEGEEWTGNDSKGGEKGKAKGKRGSKKLGGGGKVPPAKRKKASDEESGKGFIPKGVNVKRDAFILSYVRLEDYESCLSRPRCVPEQALLAPVTVRSAEIKVRAEAYIEHTAKMRGELARRKATYESIKGQLAPTGADCFFQLVPAEWLRSTAHPPYPPVTGPPPDKNGGGTGAMDVDLDSDCVEVLAPGTESGTAVNGSGNGSANGSGSESASSDVLDMRQFMCPHGVGLATGMQEAVKVLSIEAASAIFGCPSTRQHTSSTSLSSFNFRCDHCFQGTMERRKEAWDESASNIDLIALVEDSDKNPSDLSYSYYLTRTWLSEFKKHTTNLQKDPKKGLFHSPIVEDDDVVIVEADGKPEGAGGRKLDVRVNSPLMCEHLKPQVGFKRRALCISTAAWRAIRTQFPEALEIGGRAVECRECLGSAQRAKDRLEEGKAQRGGQLAVPALLQLSKRRKIFPRLLDDEDYLKDPLAWGRAHGQSQEQARRAQAHVFFAVDGQWLAAWRQYLVNKTCPPPPPLSNAAIRCNCGGLLLPKALQMLHACITPSSCVPAGAVGSAQLAVVTEDEPERGGAGAGVGVGPLPPVELLSADEWVALLKVHSPQARSAADAADGWQIYPEGDLGNGNGGSGGGGGGGSGEGVDTGAGDVWTARLEWIPRKAAAGSFDRVWAATDNGTGDWTETGTGNGNGHGNGNGNGTGTVGEWEWLPSACQECIQGAEQRHLQALSVYTNASLRVVHLRDEADLFAETGLPPSTSTSDSPEDVPRRSVRSKGKKGNGTMVVDSTDTLGLLKLKICEALAADLPPGKQRVYDSKGILLLGQSTLADFEIKAGGTVYVIERTGTLPGEEEEDFLDCFNTHMTADETGFGGTLLTSSFARPPTAPTATSAPFSAPVAVAVAEAESWAGGGSDNGGAGGTGGGVTNKVENNVVSLLDDDSREAPSPQRAEKGGVKVLTAEQLQAVRRDR
ncbi:hypothetical protein B484DRAFT_429047, partial [Ochromonadaceae sp. CCMP2298]